jgi:hypothetical protein
LRPLRAYLKIIISQGNLGLLSITSVSDDPDTGCGQSGLWTCWPFSKLFSTAAFRNTDQSATFEKAGGTQRRCAIPSRVSIGYTHWHLM